ncbi:MAG: hypothetical protein LBB50_01865 [Oscillospiraceae bacterium]|jgi:hypothetical protein|nr:hypothetical protein [Oscillospiraceae bacterium]
MQMQKQAGTARQAGAQPTAGDLALIHRYSRTELPAQDVYIFAATLCDNEIDRDGERFTIEALHTLATLFVGKTGIFDHSGKTGDQVMRVFETWVEESAAQRTADGKPYAALHAKVYILRGPENEALIRAIDGGIKKEISVSCAVQSVKCSVCGKPFAREGCTHRKGAVYDGAVCHAVLEHPTDAYEFSFVAIPAQPAAGVRKNKHPEVKIVPPTPTTHTPAASPQAKSECPTDALQRQLWMPLETEENLAFKMSGVESGRKAGI